MKIMNCNQIWRIMLLFIFLVYGEIFWVEKTTARDQRQDTCLTSAIKETLMRPDFLSKLSYPNSVKSFYLQNNFGPHWIKAEKDSKQTFEGMLVLDCVLQFGLNHADYHPEEITYDYINKIHHHPEQISCEAQARFDIMFSDALISLINHLHFGKLNPNFNAYKIDSGSPSNFHAKDVLLNSMQQQDFMSSLLSVQPKLTAYRLLQSYLHLLKGQFLDDCYDVPEAEVRRIAINMERLRWVSLADSAYVHINIPSYTLKLHEPDTIFNFKVIVGKTATPTPVLKSEIKYFTTAPDRKIPQQFFIKKLLPSALKDPAYLDKNHYSIFNQQGHLINPTLRKLHEIKDNSHLYFARQSSACDHSLGIIAFRFSNPNNILLHDNPEQKLFKNNDRSLSRGCISVDSAGKLAALLLKYDGTQKKIPLLNKAILKYQNQNFNFKTAVPIIITYLTCEMRDGILQTYPDIYNLDHQLEVALYKAK